MPLSIGEDSGSGAGMNQSSGESASCHRESANVHNDLRQTVLLSGERGRNRCYTLLPEPIVERRHVGVQDLSQAPGVLLELRLEVVGPLSRRGWGPVVGADEHRVDAGVGGGQLWVEVGVVAALSVFVEFAGPLVELRDGFLDPSCQCCSLDRVPLLQPEESALDLVDHGHVREAQTGAGT